jgi:hypothetical protein
MQHLLKVIDWPRFSNLSTTTHRAGYILPFLQVSDITLVAAASMYSSVTTSNVLLAEGDERGRREEKSSILSRSSWLPKTFAGPNGRCRSALELKHMLEVCEAV